ncbi:MAG TPA: class I SAM-dependent methyltransferase [Candidatus Latescibacteria bacterium]|nr:class I SAM-dependent methyltransferase [Candidatus Latescibacterota bacterium]
MRTQAKGLLGKITTAIRNKARQICWEGRGRLLDVGCGNSFFLSQLEDRVDLRFFGLDRSWDLLTEARCKVDRVRLAQGLMEDLPFRDFSFDWVVCLSTLYNLPGLEEVRHALKEMMRVCKPGGRVVVDVRNRANPYMRLKYRWHGLRSDFPVKAYYLSQFVEVFEEEGFEVERVVPIGPNHSWLALAYLIQARKGE